MRALHARTWAATACAWMAAPVLAGPPLASETADAVPAGTWELEGYAMRGTQRGSPAFHGQGMTLAAGIGHDTQLSASYARERQQGDTAQGLRVAGKTTFVAPQDGHTGWGLRYTAATAREPGSGWKLQGLELLVAATHELAPQWLLHANVGVVRDRSARQSTTTWSVGIEGTGDFVWAADLYGDDRGRPSVSTGVGYTVAEGFSINAVVALQFEQPRVRTVTLGAKLVF